MDDSEMDPPAFHMRMPKGRADADGHVGRARAVNIDARKGEKGMLLAICEMGWDHGHWPSRASKTPLTFPMKIKTGLVFPHAQRVRSA